MGSLYNFRHYFSVFKALALTFETLSFNPAKTTGL